MRVTTVFNNLLALQGAITTLPRLTSSDHWLLRRNQGHDACTRTRASLERMTYPRTMAHARSPRAGSIPGASTARTRAQAGGFGVCGDQAPEGGPARPPLHAANPCAMH